MEVLAITPIAPDSYFGLLVHTEEEGTPGRVTRAVTGKIKSHSKVGPLTYYTVSTQCLKGSNNHMSIVNNTEDGSTHLSSPYGDLPIGTIVIGHDDPYDDWGRFKRALPEQLREEFRRTIGIPFVRSQVAEQVHFKTDNGTFAFSKVEGFEVATNGRSAMTVSPAEVSVRGQARRHSVSRLERDSEWPAETWRAMTFSHHLHGWRARDKELVQGLVSFHI